MVASSTSEHSTSRPLLLQSKNPENLTLMSFTSHCEAIPASRSWFSLPQIVRLQCSFYTVDSLLTSAKTTLQTISQNSTQRFASSPSFIPNLPYLSTDSRPHIPTFAFILPPISPAKTPRHPHICLLLCITTLCCAL